MWGLFLVVLVGPLTPSCAPITSVGPHPPAMPPSPHRVLPCCCVPVTLPYPHHLTRSLSPYCAPTTLLCPCHPTVPPSPHCAPITQSLCPRGSLGALFPSHPPSGVPSQCHHPPPWEHPRGHPRSEAEPRLCAWRLPALLALGCPGFPSRGSALQRNRKESLGHSWPLASQNPSGASWMTFQKQQPGGSPNLLWHLLGLVAEELLAVGDALRG